MSSRKDVISLVWKFEISKELILSHINLFSLMQRSPLTVTLILLRHTKAIFFH